MSRILRRTFLTRSAQTAVAVGLAAEFAPLWAAPQDRGFQIGACDWSLGKHSKTAAFDVAKEIGLDGVQVSMGTVANDMQLRRAEVQKEYAEAAKRTGLEVASLAIGEMNSVPLKSDPRAAQWLLESIDVCKAMGLRVVMPACFAKGDLDMQNTKEIDTLVAALKPACAKAEKAGVVVGIENYLSADDNLAILDRVGSPAMKVYYDVGNSTDKGRDVYKEIRKLGKLICEFHFKDGKSRLGAGRIDFKAVRKAIDDIGYRGWLQLEASTPKGIVTDYTADCTFLRPLYPREV